MYSIPYTRVLTISQRTLLTDFGDLFGNPENPIFAYSRSPLNLGEELNCQQQSPLFSIWSSFRLLRILLGKLEYLKRINNYSIWGQWNLVFYDRTIERCSCNKILAFYFFHEINFFFSTGEFSIENWNRQKYRWGICSATWKTIKLNCGQNIKSSLSSPVCIPCQKNFLILSIN